MYYIHGICATIRMQHNFSAYHTHKHICACLQEPCTPHYILTDFLCCYINAILMYPKKKKQNTTRKHATTTCKKLKWKRKSANEREREREIELPFSILWMSPKAKKDAMIDRFYQAFVFRFRKKWNSFFWLMHFLFLWDFSLFASFWIKPSSYEHLKDEQN